MYNPVIVIGTNYFVLWNAVHLTIYVVYVKRI